MNVINQVLAQLKRRGLTPAPGEGMVRAVEPSPQRSIVLPLAATGLLLLLLALWLARPTPQAKVAAGNIVRNHTSVQSAVAPTNTASTMAELPVASEPPVAPAQPAIQAQPVPATTPDAKPVTHKPAAKPHAETRHVAEAKPVTQTAAKPPVPAPAAPLPVKRVSAAQQADAEFRKAVALMQHGRVSDAIAGYQTALRLDAGHQAARQALVALLLESGRKTDAERVLQEGVNAKPEQTELAMLLARLQVDRGAVGQALATLEKTLPHADTQAECHAFYAALLQRQNRHKEAITHYQIALQLAPGNGAWLMGYGISLQAVQRKEDARDAYRRALDSGTLSPELQAFVQQRLKSL